MSNKFRTHYDNLQVAENASIEVIKGAYKFLTQKYHPDKNQGDEERCNRNLKIINDAYKVLSDPVARMEHDEWISIKRQQFNEKKAKGGLQPEPEPEPEVAYENVENSNHGYAKTCPDCGSHIRPLKIKRGKRLYLWFTFLFVMPIWVIHFLYAYGYKYLCPECGYVLRSDRKIAVIIMLFVGPIVFIMFLATLAPRSHTCHSTYVEKTVLDIARKSLDYSDLGLRNKKQTMRDENADTYHCSGEIYAADKPDEAIAITYIIEQDRKEEYYYIVTVEGI